MCHRCSLKVLLRVQSFLEKQETPEHLFAVFFEQPMKCFFLTNLQPSNKGQYTGGMTKVNWAMGNWAEPCTDSKVTGPGQDRAGKNRGREA